ncbi:hypothetical protein SAMN05421828_12013 [Acidiphilium rubrum]|uniref:Sulfotransferase family protein n=3 Tax=Acidiphilium TaxID=522 RepID=A0A8G2CME8_ACIRU|nr:hypothetical protein SAMN05421828_12013 [Acidiphilium rubrum]
MNFRHLRYHATRRSLSPKLGFVHMPKAGGTGLIRDIEAILRPLAVTGGIDCSQTGSFTAFSTMPSAFRGSIFVDPMEIPADADVIAGHFARQTIESRFPGSNLITILREPRARLLSHWFYLGNYTDDVLALYGDWGQTMALARCNLPEFISAPAIACHTDNLMTRMLLWPHDRVPPADFIAPQDDAMLITAARAAIDRFAFADVLENPAMHDRLIRFLRQTYGQTIWSRLERLIYARRAAPRNEAAPPKPGARQPMADELTDQCLSLLDQRSRLDRHLWRHVAARVLPQADLDALAETSYRRTVDRFDRLIAASQQARIDDAA